jgi:membrane protease YdiL (CAAX protease family)
MSTVSNTLRRTVARFPLTTFFILTYFLSWFSAPFTDGQLLPYGPALAAVLALAIGQGRLGLAGLWSQMKHWRVGWRWYVIAPGIVVTYLLLALVVSVALGATIDGSEALTATAIASVVIELVFLGGMWEEPGWSGYSLPALQAHFAGRPYGLLKASLVMAGFRALWHVPLVTYGIITWYDALFVALALQLILTWLYNKTRGSLPVVMLAHLASNVVGGGIMVRLFTGSDQTLYYVVFIVTACLLGVVLNSRNGWSMGTVSETSSRPVAVTS